MERDRVIYKKAIPFGNMSVECDACYEFKYDSF